MRAAPVNVSRRTVVAAWTVVAALVVVLGGVTAARVCTAPAGWWPARPEPVVFTDGGHGSWFLTGVYTEPTWWQVAVGRVPWLPEGAEPSRPGPVFAESAATAWAAAHRFVGRDVPTVLRVRESVPGAAAAAGFVAGGEVVAAPVVDTERSQSRLGWRAPDGGPVLDPAVTVGVGVVAEPAAAPPLASTRGWDGPSAGLVLTLAYLDRLTGGDLTGGRPVAGTGTIAVDGTVGAIGALDEKVTGAAAAGIDVFVYPAAMTPTVHPEGMTLVPVASVGDAVAWLCANGGVSSLCPSG